MQGFELKAKQWFRHGDSGRVDPIGGEQEVSAFCSLCNQTWDCHGRVKLTGDIICSGSWVLVDYEEEIESWDF
jgi:hypothetical protein